MKLKDYEFTITNIKGKGYVDVGDRIKAFSTCEEFQGWRIENEMLQYTPEFCLFRTTIKNPEGVVMAIGHAEELRASSVINKTSMVENCETSSVGRALGLLGIGEGPIATVQEVNQAINVQNTNKEVHKEFTQNSNNNYQPSYGNNNQQNIPENKQEFTQNSQYQEEFTNIHGYSYKKCFSKERQEYFWGLADRSLTDTVKALGFKSSYPINYTEPNINSAGRFVR